MTIYYYNGCPIETPFSINSDKLIYETTSLSLKRKVTTTEAQRWVLEFNVTMNPYSGEGEGEGAMFLAHAVEPFKTHKMIMPQFPSVNRLAVLDKCRIPNNSHVAGMNEIRVSAGYPSGIPNGDANQVFPRGLFISFDNHNKVYVVTETAVMESGAAFLKIFPRLQQPLPTGTEVNLGNSCELHYMKDTSLLKGLAFKNSVISSPGTIRVIEQV